MGSNTAYLTKKVTISCLHELKSPSLTDEENIKTFGKCFHIHGHDYGIEVTIKGEIDPTSGLICDRDSFFEILDKDFVQKLNGTHLNDLISITTGEALAEKFFDMLQESLAPIKLHQICLQETAKNHFTVKRS